MIKEREDAERRRQMTDAEVLIEKAKDGLLDKEKKTMKVLKSLSSTRFILYSY